MSENAKFLITNLHLLATSLTATSEGKPVSNTQISKRGRVWRSTDATDQVIEGEMGTVYKADMFVLSRHNLSPAATVQLVLKTGGSGGTTEYDSGEVALGTMVPIGVFEVGVDEWGGIYDEGQGFQTYAVTFDIAEFDYYQITLKDSGNPDGYMQVGQIMLGDVWQPSENISRGIRLLMDDGIENIRTAGLSLHSEGIAETYRTLIFDLAHLNSAEKTTVITEMGRGTKATDIFVSVYPDDGGQTGREYQMICRRMNRIDMKHRFRQEWKQQFVLEEV